MYDLLYTLYENEEGYIPKAFMMVLDGLKGENIPTLQRQQSPHELGTRSTPSLVRLTVSAYRYENGISTGTSKILFSSWYWISTW